MAAKANLTLRQLERGDIDKGLSAVAVTSQAYAECLTCAYAALKRRLSGFAGTIDRSWRDLPLSIRR